MSDSIQDRDRGHEIIGPRLTVYHLLTSFLDPTVTEEKICLEYGITAQQVAKARAYILSNPETILAEHLKIEARMAKGNPPEVREAAERAKATFLGFKQWLAEHRRAIAADKEQDALDKSSDIPSFPEWMAEQNNK